MGGAAGGVERAVEGEGAARRQEEAEERDGPETNCFFWGGVQVTTQRLILACFLIPLFELIDC